MTYHDPKERREALREYNRYGSGMWVGGAIAAVVVLGLVMWGFTGGRDNVAVNSPPAATAPAETTGSGGAASGSGRMQTPAPAPAAPAPAAPAR